MNYKIYSPMLVLILLSMAACAQQKKDIKNVQLFSWVQMPGNIPVNEKGEPQMGPQTIYTIVVETKGKPVEWNMASTKNKTYSITPSLIKVLPYDAGINDATGQRILLTPAKGHQLWLLALTPMETGTAPKDAATGTGIMVLQGKTGNQKFSRTIQKETAIRTLPVY